MYLLLWPCLSLLNSSGYLEMSFPCFLSHHTPRIGGFQKGNRVGWLGMVMGVIYFLLCMCVCLSESFRPSLLTFPYSSYLYGTSNKDTHFRPGPSPHFLSHPSPVLVLEWQSSMHHLLPALTYSEVHGAMGMEQMAGAGGVVVDPNCRERRYRGKGGWVVSVG